MTTLNEERMIDEIRSYIFATDQTKNERLAELSRLYAESCASANARLTKCDDFLKQGLRTQAITLAEEPPDLLQLVDVLNFAELDEWQELVGSYELERFEFLKTSIAESIAAAYDQQNRIKGLLRTHRQLNLAQASMPSRIAMLRKLADAEPETQYWKDDLRTFEEHYASQLITEASRAERTGESAIIENCVARMEHEPWSEGTIPVSVQKQYLPIAARVHQEKTFPGLAATINSSVESQDENALRRAMRRWEQVTERMRQFDPHWRLAPQWQDFEKTGREWIQHFDEQAKQKAFRADVQKLVDAMTNKMTESEVAFFYEKAIGHGYPLPDAVQAKVNDFKYHASEIRTLNSAILIAALIGLIVLIVLGFFVVWTIVNK